MSNSNEFITLKNRIAELENTLLPRYSLSGNIVVEDKWQDRMSGYIVLVCAEIEFYVETIALKILKEEYSAFLSSGKTSKILFSLVAYFKTHWPPQDSPCNDCFLGKTLPFLKPHKIFHIQGPRDIKTVLSKIILTYEEKIIKKNHGIKSENLEKILLPLGFITAELDSKFIADLDSFVAERGQYAHMSVKTEKNPRNLKEKVKNLLDEFEIIDTKIRSL